MAKKKGTCVICGNFGNLTRDHVPPKGVMPASEIEIHHLRPGDENRKVERAYQAPTFPTICAECNGKRLGEQYDPALISFANGLIRWTRWSEMFDLRGTQNLATVDINPAAVARAVVGHLLAAERSRKPCPPGKMLEAMRRFFLEDDSGSELRIFVWPYDGELVIARGFSTMELVPASGTTVRITRKPIFGDVLKFFPLAFWVLWGQSERPPIQCAEIPLFVDTQTQIQIPLYNVPPRHWPEFPLSHEAVAWTDSTALQGKTILKHPRRKL